MPTIMSHAIVPIAAAVIMNAVHRRYSKFDTPLISKPIIFTAMALAMLPDADVIGFAFGIEYAHSWGHRGASHAIFFAAIIAGLITAIMRPVRWKIIFAFLWFSMASHGILDAFTNGGLGPALYWPFSDVRIFAPFNPIIVSPIGLNFFSERGLVTLYSELQWIVLPLIIGTSALCLLLRQRRN